MEAYSEVIFIPGDCITCCKLVGYIEYAYNEVKLPSLALHYEHLLLYM